MTSLLNNTRRPDITFYPSGRIDITARLARLLRLRKGDVIDIAEDNGEYHIYVRIDAQSKVGRHEATVYPSNKGRRQHSYNFRTYSTKLTNIMYQVTGACKEAALRLAAGIPTTETDIITIPIITRKPL